MDEKELIDMKQIPMNRRDNICVGEMKDYINGGLTVESEEHNGALVYIPYGIWCDIFNAIDTGIDLYRNEIRELKQNIEGLENAKDEQSIILAKVLVRDTKIRIKELEEKMYVLENILPIIHEV